MTETRNGRNVWLGALFVLAVIAVAFTVPLPGILSAIPFPDLPDLPSWLKWVWRAVVLGAIVLAVVGEVEKERSQRGEDES